MFEPKFPTAIHRQAAEDVVDFSIGSPVQAVLLVNSCARGTAIPQSDLDIALLIDPEMSARERESLSQAWSQRYEKAAVFRELERLSRFSTLHLDFFDGQWVPDKWDEGGGPDAFEIEIGNRVAHAAPLWEGNCAFADLRTRWLPYYGEPLREERLRMVSGACRLDMDRINFAASRGLNFYAFDRLYHLFQEFLQALFIARRVYPIAYNKWIREQVQGWLGLGELHSELESVLALRNLQHEELIEKADRLGRLLTKWGS